MKILIITPYFFEPHRWMISGYKTALNLAKKHRVLVLTTGRPKYKRLNKNLVIYRMRDFFFPDPLNLSIVPGLFWHLGQVIKKEKPDVFLVNKNMYYTSLAIIALRLRGKKVYTQVDTFPGINWFSVNPLIRLIHWICARTIGLLLLKLSTKVILLHEGLVPVARRFNLNYTVIHNGVDLTQIDTAKPRVTLVNKKTKNVVYLGRLESIKGYYDFLDVASRLARKRSDLRFYLIGDIAQKAEIVDKFASDKIVFLGHQKNVYPLLKAMDIFVLPSYSEGLSNALMEAMACSLACLATNVGGNKVLIKNNVNGLLFPPGKLKMMEEKIALLARNSRLRRRLADCARQTIVKDFDWTKISEKYTKLFSE